LAAAVGNSLSVKLLLKNGADLHILDNEERSPLDGANLKLGSDGSIGIITRLSFQMLKVMTLVKISISLVGTSIRNNNTVLRYDSSQSLLGEILARFS